MLCFILMSIVIRRNIVINGPLMTMSIHSSLSYIFGVGRILGLTLTRQIVTGVILAIFFIPDVDQTSYILSRIMREVYSGWLLRYTHSNGARLFFTMIYVHIMRGLWFYSHRQPRRVIWLSGVLMLLLIIVIAFLGYVLPFGQISYWAATVITNMLGALPLVGIGVVHEFWGGYTVSSPTLIRFFSLHYFLPFVVLGLVVLHLMELHSATSRSPVKAMVDILPFDPFYRSKDILGLWPVVFILLSIVFLSPNMLSHPDNMIEAIPLTTPAHIVPEWYFLPFYSILRAIPNKLGGVIAILFSILVLAVSPLSSLVSLDTKRTFPLFRRWIVLLLFLWLGWVGSCRARYPWVQQAILLTFLWFINFLIFLPILSICEMW